MNTARPASLKYDIAIIGGGLVGASLAVALSEAARQLSLSIAVFESVPLRQLDDQPLQPSYDARSTALSYGSACLLEMIGVWPAVNDSAAAIRHIHVSDRGQFGSVHLSAEREQVPALGYVVENRSLGRALFQSLAEAGDSVETVCPVTVTATQPRAQGMALEIELEDGEHQVIEAGLVVMADGGRSPLREQLGISYQRKLYEQFAVIANLTPDRPHQDVAYERFTADGPMALLPLTDDAEGKPRCALVWTVPVAEVDEVMGIDDAEFIKHLQQAFGYRAGRILAVGERHSYPLQLCQAEEQVRQGLVVLGNAAHTLHPIAGQGFNLALRGALALAESLIAAASSGQALGSLATLQQFEAKLEWDQHKTIGFSDQVTGLFSSRRSGPVLARNLALTALDLLPPLKHAFSRSAMGLDVPAPKLRIESKFDTRASRLPGAFRHG